MHSARSRSRVARHSALVPERVYILDDSTDVVLRGLHGSLECPAASSRPDAALLASSP